MREIYVERYDEMIEIMKLRDYMEKSIADGFVNQEQFCNEYAKNFYLIAKYLEGILKTEVYSIILFKHLITLVDPYFQPIDKYGYEETE